MKYKNSRQPFLIYSILLHIVILFSVWWFSPKRELPDVSMGTLIDIIPMPREVEVKPPIEIKQPPISIAETPEEEKVEKTPSPPKPSVDLEKDWSTTKNKAVNKRPQEKITGDKLPDPSFSETTIIDGNTIAPQNPRTQVSVNIERHHFSVTSTSDRTLDAPQAEIVPIQLDSKGNPKGVSPTIATPSVNYGSRRGDAFHVASMSNTSGGGSSTSSTGKISDVYIKMMTEIAEGLITDTTAKKIDVVFLLDETGSMVDNIRGIRAYVDILFDAFKREGRDTTYGLVTFTDKVKYHGRTAKLGTFMNWLFKIDVDRGGDISEAGLDALMTAVKRSKFRSGSQRFFILASDAAFHDVDYDGKSIYSLDSVISTLQHEKVRVEVIGIDYLPIKQIALATGGNWRAIPGKGYLEYTPPLTMMTKMLSKLGTLSGDATRDKIIVHVNNLPRPKQVTLTWKVLNPLGERCYGPFKDKRDVPNNDSTKIELTPILNSTVFKTIPGTYTVIYRIENDHGEKSILRRTLNY